MVGARCLLPASCNVDARACTAVAAATRRTGPTLPGCGGRRSCTPSSHAPGFLLPAWLHPCIPQAGEPAGSGAEIWAEPACWAPGTPTGPARPGQSAGGGGEERKRRCTEGELRTREWRVSMRCGPSPPSRVDRRVVEPVFFSELPRCVLGRLKDVAGWRDSWEEPSSLNYATRRRPCAVCRDEWNR